MILINIIVLTLSLFNSVNGDWDYPYFLDLKRDGIKFLPQSEVENTREIMVREEMTPPFLLTKINYNGKVRPKIGLFANGSNIFLNATIEKNQKYWYIWINEKQDYEFPAQRTYLFQVYIQQQGLFMQSYIKLKTQNIFDNYPIIHYNPNPCKVPELKSHFTTNCNFIIYNIDGITPKNIPKLSVERRYDKYFEFVKTTSSLNYKQNFKLRIKQHLVYIEQNFYQILVNVIDTNGKSNNISAIIKVIGVQTLPPIWTKPIRTVTVTEETRQMVQIEAININNDINTPICYALDFGNTRNGFVLPKAFWNSIEIQKGSGIIDVFPIDREKLHSDILIFNISAFKCENKQLKITQTATFIIKDINDNKPKVTIYPNAIKITQSRHLTLPLKQFMVEDMDLAENGTYSLQLSNIEHLEVDKAFRIMPDRGYQRSYFTIMVKDPTYLNYDNITWRRFELKITAAELNNPNRKGEAILSISLENRGDPFTVFGKTLHRINVAENVLANSIIADLKTAVIDTFEKADFTLLDYYLGLYLDENTGILKTIRNSTFDYERKQEIILQVQASGFNRTNFKEILIIVLVINVLDVNDETPKLYLPSSDIKVIPELTSLTGSMLLTDQIHAEDADSSALLEIDILWNETNASKNGKSINITDYKKAFVLNPIKEIPQKQSAQLILTTDAAEILKYEKVDKVSLIIQVKDLKQEINKYTATGLLTLRIASILTNTIIPDKRSPYILKIPLKKNRHKISQQKKRNTPKSLYKDIFHKMFALLYKNSTTESPPEIRTTEEEEPICTSVALGNGISTEKKFRITEEFTKEPVPYIISHERDINSETGYIDELTSPFGSMYFSTANDIYTDITSEYSTSFNYDYTSYQLRETESINNKWKSFERIIEFRLLMRPTGSKTIEIQLKEYGKVIITKEFDFPQTNSIYWPQNIILSPFNASVLPNFKDNYKVSKLIFDDTFNIIAYNVLDFNPSIENITEVITKNTPYVEVYNDLDSSSAKEHITESVIENVSYVFGTTEPQDGTSFNPTGLLDMLESSTINSWADIEESLTTGNINTTPLLCQKPRIMYPLENDTLRICYSRAIPLLTLYKSDCDYPISLFEILDPSNDGFGKIKYKLIINDITGTNLRLKFKNHTHSKLYMTQSFKIIPDKIYQIKLIAKVGHCPIYKYRNFRIIFSDIIQSTPGEQNGVHSDESGHIILRP